MRRLLVLAIAATMLAGAVHAAEAPRPPRPVHRTVFPPIVDWNSLKIGLVRTGCFGTCAAYRVTVQGDGTVVYDSGQNTLVPGHHVTHIAPDKVRDLFAAFQKADFFWLHDAYVSEVTDLPSYALMLSFDGHRKGVQDYAGTIVHMPPEVTALENQVDAVAGTHKWLFGNGDTVPALRAEGWNFREPTQANALLLARAAVTGSPDLVQALLGAGVPLKGGAAPYACRAADTAAARGDIAMLRSLLDAGAPLFSGDPIEYASGIPWSGGTACDVLFAAAGNGAPDVLKLVLGRHPDIKRISPEGDSVLTALGQRTVYRQVARPRDLAASAALLLAAGAPVNHRAHDKSALMMATGDAALVRVLLKAGAKGINARDSNGMTPLMNAENPEVARALLEGGADPWARSADGHTVLELAHFAHRTAIETALRDWMAHHPQRKSN